VAENDDWEAYHAYRKRQRHERLYNQPYPQLATAELMAFTPEILAVCRVPQIVRIERPKKVVLDTDNENGG
jgi:hypothetical protein